MLPHPFFLKIPFNTVVTSKLRSSKWSVFLRSPHQDPLCNCLVSHTCHIPSPAHLSRFDYPNNIRRGVQFKTLPADEQYCLDIYSLPRKRTSLAHVQSPIIYRRQSKRYEIFAKLSLLFKIFQQCYHFNRSCMITNICYHKYFRTSN
jgi:hypothetical protein